MCDGSSGTVSLCNLCVEFPLLPVEITYFELQPLQFDRGVQLKWETEVEVNNDGFVIQRSFDAFNWEDIGFKEGKNSDQTTLYTYSDLSMHSGDVYYRLKQIDFNGETSYSDTRIITNNKYESLLDEAIRDGKYYNYMGQLVEEKKGLLIIVYKDQSFKVFLP